MAVIKPKLESVAAVCDVVGMTDIPVVSQAAELASGCIGLAQGDLVGFGLSVGSMVPVVGKVAEGAKVARRAKKIADGVSAAGKDAKLLSLTARKKDNIAESASKARKAAEQPAKKLPPQPSKTAAKKAEKKPVKEIQDDKPHFDSDEWLGIPEPKPAGDSIFAQGQPSVSSQKINLQKYNVPTNSNPALNNSFRSTGKPGFGI